MRTKSATARRPDIDQDRQSPTERCIKPRRQGAAYSNVQTRGASNARMTTEFSSRSPAANRTSLNSPATGHALAERLRLLVSMRQAQRRSCRHITEGETDSGANCRALPNARSYGDCRLRLAFPRPSAHAAPIQRGMHGRSKPEREERIMRHIWKLRNHAFNALARTPVFLWLARRNNPSSRRRDGPGLNSKS